MIMRIGGRAKVLKKAVAPAMRKGSLAANSRKEAFSRIQLVWKNRVIIYLSINIAVLSNWVI